MHRGVGAIRRSVAAHPGFSVVLAATSVRLLVLVAAVANQDAFVAYDTRAYLALADHPSGYWDSSAPSWSVGLLRPPGYPLMLALPRSLSQGLVLSGCLQVAVSIAVAWLTFTAGQALFGKKVGLIAGMWAALDPTSVAHSARLLTEAPFAALLALALALTAWAVRSRSAGQAVLAGLALAAATFVRPIGLYLPLLLVPSLLLAERLTSRPKALRIGAVILLAYLIPVGGWITRNQAVTGVATFSTIDGYNMLEYRAAGAVTAETGVPIADVRLQLRRRLATRTHPEMNPAERSREKGRLGVEVVREHPVGYLRQARDGAVRTLFLARDSNVSDLTEGRAGAWLVRPLLGALSVASAIAMSCGAVLGGLRLARRRDLTAIALLVIPPAYLLVIGSGPEAASRFRVPMVPFLAILSAVAIVDLASTRKDGYAGRQTM